MNFISKFILAFAICFSSILNCVAQGNSSSSWSTKFGFQNSFIENKGQFVIPSSFGNTSPILFAVDQGGKKIFFTKKGITYTFLVTSKKIKDQREMERERRAEFKSPEDYVKNEKEEHELKVKTDQVTMLWQGANSNVDVVATDITTDYHCYNLKNSNNTSQNIPNAKGFKKLTYKNIYPNIDIEYVFSEKGGLKYTLTLHPGADPSLVKMVYDNHVSLNSNGDVLIDTKFGDIIDHAPLSFYSNNTNSIVSSKFVKNGKTISFELEKYDNTKTLIIDPWTQTPAFTSNWDCVWECEKDGAGNVYIMGGVTPVQIIKYNAAGTIQWTYNTPYDTTSWIGTFATDNAGNSYVTNGTTPGIIKLNTAGALQWTVGGGALVEYWNIAFNCDQTKLIVGGTDNLRGAIFDINTSNGAVLTTKIVAYGSAFGFPPSIQEVRSITPCGNGRYYFLTLDSIGYINQNITLCGNNASFFKTTSTHGLSYKCENYRYDNTGIMAIRADVNYVYTHNGTTLFKRSLANAAIIASVAIPGGAATTSLGQKAVNCSGIDIDAAGNIYVGSTNAVTKFSPALVQLATATVPFNVYDVHVNSGGDVIACGSTGNSGSSSRTGYIQSISSLSAGTTLSLTCCDANICQPSSKCLTDPAFNLTAATLGGTWSGTGITNSSTGIFNPATAGVGSHVITYSLACGVGTTTINVSACGTVTLCLNSGSITASGGGGTYTWASTTTSVDCSGCFGGACSFLCAGVTVPSWTASGTTVVAPSSSVFPIKVKDVASGVTFTFTTLASIPQCTTTTCATLTMAISSQTNVNCFGANTGSATINASGGTGPYTYTWTPGSLSGASQTGLAAGIYTVAIKDANLCPGTGTLTITQPTAALSAIITATTTSSCGTPTGGATVTATGGTAGYTYSWSPSGGSTIGVSNLGLGNNTVTVKDSKGCSQSAIANITSATGPTLSISSQTNVNCFGANTGTASVNAIGGTGPYNYTWTPGNLSGISQSSLLAGIYTITVADANLCTKSITLSITQPTAALSAVISATTATGCGLNTGGATVTASGGTGSYTYSWNPSGGLTAGVSNLATGNNTVLVTDVKGCNVTAIANIPCSSFCQTNGNLAIFSNYDGGILTINVDQNIPNLKVGICTYEPIQVNFTGPFVGNVTQVIYAGFNSNQNNNNCGLGNFPTSITGVPSGIVTINPPMSPPLVGYTPVHNNGAGPWGGQMIGTAGNCDTTINGGGGNTPDEIVYYFQQATAGTLLFHQTQYNCWLNQTLNISAGGNCCILPPNSCPTISLSVISSSNVSCYGGINGAAAIAVSGSAGPYTYNWMPGNLTSASQTSLSAGTYTIHATDINQCAGTLTLTISQPTSALTAIISSTTATSCGLSSGGATVTASGGTAGYTYSWSPSGGTTIGVSNLSAGNNTVTVKDSKGCSQSAIAIITSATGPTLSITSQTNVNCFGANTGIANVNGIGGTGPYSYTWSPGNLSGSSQSSLTAGTYTINITDANLCVGSGTINISQPSLPISVFVSTSPTSCGNNIGSATVTPSGGTPAYTFSWSPTGGTASVASNLAAGNYSVKVTDSKGCFTTTLATITSSIGGPTLTVNSQTNVICNAALTGAASITASGTAGPYTYTWSPNGGNASSASGLAAGTYTVLVKDASTCINSITVTISQPTAISLSISSNPENCGASDGNASITSSGGAGALTTMWSTGSTNSSITGLSSGSYSVMVTDANGCTATSTAVIGISGSLAVSAGNGSTILIGESTTLNGVVPAGASVAWSPSGSLSCATCSVTFASPLVTTIYTITATLNGCSGTSTVIVIVDIPCGELFIPSAFSPNDDGQNDVLYVMGNCITNLEFLIFDRWGEKVFETSNPTIGWDGMFNGKKMDPATFAYYLKATVNGNDVNQKGSISIIK